MTTPEMATKITKEEAEKLDPKECGGTMLPRPQADVEGQLLYRKSVICPWCGSIVVVIADTRFFKWFICCVCGGAFRA